MSSQFVAWMISLASIAAASALSPTPAVAQQQTTGAACPDNTPTAFHACALEAASSFDPPRTPDGQPDMGGVWNLPGNAFEDIEEHPAALDDSGGPTTIVDPPDGTVPMQAWSDARRSG